MRGGTLVGRGIVKLVHHVHHKICDAFMHVLVVVQQPSPDYSERAALTVPCRSVSSETASAAERNAWLHGLVKQALILGMSRYSITLSISVLWRHYGTAGLATNGFPRCCLAGLLPRLLLAMALRLHRAEIAEERRGLHLQRTGPLPDDMLYPDVLYGPWEDSNGLV